MSSLLMLLDVINPEQLSASSVVNGILIAITGYFLKGVLERLKEVQQISVSLQQEIALQKLESAKNIELVKAEFKLELEKRFAELHESH